jgi:hypothetical protein
MFKDLIFFSFEFFKTLGFPLLVFSVLFFAIFFFLKSSCFCFSLKFAYTILLFSKASCFLSSNSGNASLLFFGKTRLSDFFFLFDLLLASLIFCLTELAQIFHFLFSHQSCSVHLSFKLLSQSFLLCN